MTTLLDKLEAQGWDRSPSRSTYANVLSPCGNVAVERWDGDLYQLRIYTYPEHMGGGKFQQYFRASMLPEAEFLAVPFLNGNIGDLLKVA